MAKRIWLEPPATWEEEIRAFEAEDQSAPPAAGAIVFTGSSSIRMWTTLAQDMAPRPVLNRGFGGSQAHQVLHFAPRIVLPYHPGTVVLYTGENDLEGRTGKTPEQVLAEVAAFAGLLAQALPHPRLVLLSVKPSPARRRRWRLARSAMAATALTGIWAIGINNPKNTPTATPIATPRRDQCQIFGCPSQGVSQRNPELDWRVSRWGISRWRRSSQVMRLSYGLGDPDRDTQQDTGSVGSAPDVDIDASRT